MQARSSSTVQHARNFITFVVAALLAVTLLPGMASAAPGQSIQQMVDNAAAGSTVSVPAGVYSEMVYVNKPLTLKAMPGAIIDGGNRPFWIVAAAHDVTIDGFDMRGGSNWEHWGGITNSHNNVHYDRLTIQNNTLHGASYAAIATKLGTGHRILNNTTYNNGALGIRIDSGSGHLIAGNTIYSNNPNHAFDSGWEAGGIKVSGNYGGANNIVIEHNHAYSNNGAGIWVDVDGNNITIRHNNVHHNTRSGITYELSFGGNIHDNRVWENGYGYHEWGWGAGILIQNSSDVSVSNNTVAWNADGISVISQNRGTVRWNNVTGVSVFNNTVAVVHDGGWNTFAMGWLEDWNGVLVNNNSNNRGWGNSYWINTADGADLRFRWGSDSYWRLNEFAASPGENNARYLTSTQKNQHLSGLGIPTTR